MWGEYQTLALKCPDPAADSIGGRIGFPQKSNELIGKASAAPKSQPLIANLLTKYIRPWHILSPQPSRNKKPKSRTFPLFISETPNKKSVDNIDAVTF